ncbi:MAG: hypothetical protein HFF36_02845 [Coprobacillus sp.]|nr:hypothetical protein [Coprobacillus sp.]
MNKLDKIDIDILRDLVRRELEGLKNDKGSIGREQYEFHLKKGISKVGRN